MREIKFRALGVSEDCVKQWYYYDTQSAGWMFGNAGGKVKWICEDLQYTGLKDINGKEIYEGDILGYGQSTAIDWHQPQSGFYVNVYGGHKIPLSYNIATVSKIIGNIDENPELLEETK